MSLLKVNNLCHGYGDKILYHNASFDLYKGEHMGVVGQNGTGKSTLISILTGETVPDKGSIKWQPKIKVGYLDQYAIVDSSITILAYLKTAFCDLYKLEEKTQKLYEEYAKTGEERLLQQAAEGQSYLENNDFYFIDTKIEKISVGIGLTAIGMERVLSALSGGQRAKVIIAKLLLEQPDVLLLDEPTNFLDKEHVNWLVEYLENFPNAFVVVSHDFEFLSKISNCICDVEAQTIRKYHRGYGEFLKQKEHLREDHIRRYHAQQQVIQRTEEFIRKNIAGIKSKNAKGRRKQLERMERVAPPSFVAKPHMEFQQQPVAAQKLLQVKNLEIGYTYSLLPKLNFTVQNGQKVAITGFNGIGKTTLLKTLIGEIKKIGGDFIFAQQIKIGYYEQDLQWENKLTTPIQIIGEAYPKLTEKQIRKHLADCGVKNDGVRQSVATLSGGEQSKVKLCRLLLSPYTLLLLDEPTNHIDTDTKEELKRALIQFKGSILIVSHEESFYKEWIDEVIQIECGVCY